MLVSGAEAADWARRMHQRGVAGELRVDWKELIAFKRTFTDPVPKKREENFAKQGIDAFHGMARFSGPDTVLVEGHALKGRNIVIAAGARPVPLDFPGAKHAVTSDALMELADLAGRKLPRQRLRRLRHDRQCLGVDDGLLVFAPPGRCVQALLRAAESPRGSRVGKL
jgi:pyruvate/2-oxoglutarate dehydrogenase complex dihydrolipoamide dehydrogenase (E3) component